MSKHHFQWRLRAALGYFSSILPYYSFEHKQSLLRFIIQPYKYVCQHRKLKRDMKTEPLTLQPPTSLDSHQKAANRQHRLSPSEKKISTLCNLELHVWGVSRRMELIQNPLQDYRWKWGYEIKIKTFITIICFSASECLLASSFNLIPWWGGKKELQCQRRGTEFRQ